MANLYADGLLTPAQVAAIGHVAIESANLEILVERMICSICFFRDATRRELIERRELSGKLSILRTLINERLGDQDVLKKFNRIYDAYTGAVSERNTVIHGRWIKGALATNEHPAVAFHPKNPDRTISADKALHTAIALVEFQQELASFYALHGNKLSVTL